MILLRKQILVSLLAAVGFASSVSAAVLVETHSGAPTDDLLFSVSPPVLNQSYSWSRSSEGANLIQFGQSFTASENAKMAALTIRTGMLSTTGAPFVLNIYLLSSVNDGPLQGGEPIYTSTGNLPSAQGPRPGYMTFTLDNPVTLSKEAVYLFTLSYEGDETGGSLGFFRGEGTPEDLSGSKFWYSTNGGASFASSVVLLDLYIQGTAIPEPSLTLLLAPGAASMFFMRRRRTT